jgi:hypothetical protein
MRWSDRPADPAPREQDGRGGRDAGADRLARRLDGLPAAHPSSSGYDLAAAQDADGAAAWVEADELAGDDPEEHEAAGDAEQEAAGGQGRRPEPGPAGWSGRYPAGRIVARAAGEPYRPWFTDGGPAEPWFTADPGGPPG